MPPVDFHIDRMLAQYNRRQAPVNTIYDGSGFLIENNELRPTDYVAAPVVHTLDGPCVGLLEYFYSTERWLLFKISSPYNGHFIWNLTNPPVSLGAGGIDKFADYVVIDNRVYIFDGGSLPKKYYKTVAGHQLVDQGVPQFADTYFTACTRAAAADGVWLPGQVGTTFYYKLSWQFSNEQEIIEGNANDTARSAVLVATTDRLNLSVTVPLVGGRVPTHVNVYRRSGASGDYGYIVSWNISGIGAITINDTGYTASATRVAPINKFQMNYAAELGCYYGNRLFSCTKAGNLLYYSDVLAPDSTQLSTPIKVGANTDFFTRLIAHINFLLIVKQESMWILEGTNPSDFRLTRLPINIGSLATFATILVDGIVYFINNSGIFKYTFGAEAIPIHSDIQEYFDALQVTSQTYLAGTVARRNPITGNIDFYFPSNQSIMSYNSAANKWVGKYTVGGTNTFLQAVKVNNTVPQTRFAYMINKNYYEHSRNTLASTINTSVQLNSKIQSPTNNKFYRFVRFTYSASQDTTVNITVIVDGISYVLTPVVFPASSTEKTVKLGFTSDDLYFNIDWEQNPFIIKDIELEVEQIGSW